MFGYIRPSIGELRVKEYETYRAIYCSICHALKEHFGVLSTLSLNYDFTFAALLGLALQDDFPGYESFTCVAHPLRKHQRLKDEQHTLPFISGCVVSMVHAKVADNIADAKGIKSAAYRLTLPLTAKAGKKADSLFPVLAGVCQDMNRQQAEVEAASDTSLDAAAQPSANALSRMMMALSENPMQQRILGRFGYLLGRWIYFIDALDDLEDDLKDNGFNPFLRKFQVTGKMSDEKKQQIHQYGRELLNITAAEMAAAYELLELKRFKSILDNIVYLGLAASMERVFNRKNKNPDSTEDLSPSSVSLT